MIKLNVHEAKTHLSKYLELLERGESILLCKRNIPIAEIRPIRQPRKTKRPIGLGKGAFKIPKSFFKPLPKEIEDSFYGEEE
jgi:antitoxin (DNA-binding transcriptional repressor) of toxin-antitoxin stability system